MTVTCQFLVCKLREKRLDVIEYDYEILNILQYWTKQVSVTSW